MGYMMKYASVVPDLRNANSNVCLALDAVDFELGGTTVTVWVLTFEG